MARNIVRLSNVSFELFVAGRYVRSRKGAHGSAGGFLSFISVASVAGIALGVWVTGILARTNGWNTLISTQSIVVAFGTSALIGIVFGLWPARRAARLDPIVALRYE